MKKNHSFKETDPSRRCLICNQPLKKNLLDRAPHASRCYVCKKLKSNSTNFNREKFKAK